MRQDSSGWSKHVTRYEFSEPHKVELGGRESVAVQNLVASVGFNGSKSLPVGCEETMLVAASS